MASKKVYKRRRLNPQQFTVVLALTINAKNITQADEILRKFLKEKPYSIKIEDYEIT